MTSITKAYGGFLRVRAWCFFAAVPLVALGADGAPPTIADKQLPAEAVKVEIFEGIPDQNSWDFATPGLEESYTEPAFGFVVTPKKYSSHGINVDRATPFLFRASARVALSAGEHRIL